MTQAGCSSCNGTGMPMGCPMCGRIGKVRKKPKTSSERRNAILNETPAERQIRLKQEVEDRRREKAAHRKKKMDEIKALWGSATQEQWEQNRRTYINIIKVVKRKEQHFMTSEDT